MLSLLLLIVYLCPEDLEFQIAIVEDTMDKYQYVNALANNLMPSFTLMKFKKFTFQQDNDTKHIFRHARDYFEGQKIDVLPWPSQSPDLNPIEHVWAYMKRKLADRMFKNITQLKEALIELWSSIPLDVVENMINSMKLRLFAVIKANGEHTRH